MRVGKSASDPRGDKNSQFLWQLSILFLKLVDELLQVRPLDQLHADEVILLLGFAEVIGLDDIGMDKIGHQLGFPDEVLNKEFLGGKALTNHLDGHPLHELIRPVLLRLIDDPHTAFEDCINNLVANRTFNGL